MRKTHLIIALLLALFGGSAQAQCRADSLLYKLALQTRYKGVVNINKKECRYLTIDYKPAYPYVLGVNLKRWDVDSLTYKKLLQINDTLSVAYHSSRLNRMYKGDAEVMILNKEDYSTFTAKKFWKQFWKAYPYSSGQISVSAIAYNEACTKAIFYFECVSHPVVGEGCFVICRFENGAWVVKEKDIIGVLQM